MSVTGIEQLAVADLEAKLGSMALSTKCCGTGTCDAYTFQDMAAPRIVSHRDQRDALAIATQLGSLV